MKKILSLLIISLLITNTALAAGSPWGRYIGSFSFTSTAVSATTSQLVDSAFNFGATGTSTGLIFNSPISLSSDTMDYYVYCTNSVGSAVNSIAVLYSVNNPLAGSSVRPGDTVATSTNVDASGCATPKWLDYSFTGVTTSSSTTYFLSVQNTTASPASNYFSIQKSSAISSTNGSTGAMRAFTNFVTTNGFTTNPTVNTAFPPMVVKFGSSGQSIGSPYVNLVSHATNPNIRGARLTFSEQIVLSGITLNSCTTATAGNIFISQNGTIIYSASLDLFNRSNNAVALFQPITIPKNTAYDVTIQPVSSSGACSVVNMGNNPPADVSGTVPNYKGLEGLTLSTLFESSTSTIPLSLIFDDNPAVAGGGGTDILGNVIQ